MSRVELFPAKTLKVMNNDVLCASQDVGPCFGFVLTNPGRHGVSKDDHCLVREPRQLGHQMVRHRDCRPARSYRFRG